MHVWTESVKSVVAASNFVFRVHFPSTASPKRFYVSTTPSSVSHSFNVSRYALLQAQHILTFLNVTPLQRRTVYEIQEADITSCHELFLARSRLERAVNLMSTVSRKANTRYLTVDEDHSD